MDKDVFNMDDRLFIRGKNGELYEGPLGDKANNIKLLFVMKEPDGEELNCFWLKQVFKDEEKGIRYFNSLNIYIGKLFGKKAKIKDELLNKIAFINLFPFFGKSHVVEGKGYSALMQDSVWKDAKTAELKEQISVNDENKIILRNRIEIIKNALDNGVCIVAHFEIIDFMKKHFREIELVDTIEDNDFHINSYLYKGDEKIYAIQHPTTRKVSYKKIEELFKGVKVI